MVTLFSSVFLVFFAAVSCGSLTSASSIMISSPVDVQVSVEVGQNLTLECHISEVKGRVVLWKHNQQLLFGGTVKMLKNNRYHLENGFDLHIFPVTTDDNGNFSCSLPKQNRPQSIYTVEVHNATTTTTTTTVSTQDSTVAIGSWSNPITESDSISSNDASMVPAPMGRPAGSFMHWNEPGWAGIPHVIVSKPNDEKNLPSSNDAEEHDEALDWANFDADDMVRVMVKGEKGGPQSPVESTSITEEPPKDLADLSKTMTLTTPLNDLPVFEDFSEDSQKFPAMLPVFAALKEGTVVVEQLNATIVVTNTSFSSNSSSAPPAAGSMSSTSPATVSLVVKVPNVQHGGTNSSASSLRGVMMVVGLLSIVSFLLIN